MFRILSLARFGMRKREAGDAGAAVLSWRGGLFRRSCAESDGILVYGFVGDGSSAGCCGGLACSARVLQECRDVVARSLHEGHGVVEERALHVWQCVRFEVGCGCRLRWPQVEQRRAAVLSPAGRGAGGHRHVVAALVSIVLGSCGRGGSYQWVLRFCWARRSVWSRMPAAVVSALVFRGLNLGGSVGSSVGSSL